MYSSIVAHFVVLARRIHTLAPETDSSGIMGDIEHLLDISVATNGYIIRERGAYDIDARIDLSQIDFDVLKAHFERGHKHIEAEKLCGAIEGRLKLMVQSNRSWADYLERFHRLIDEYNLGSLNVEIFFDKLLVFAQ